jgi:hypothetical protein
MGTHPSTGKEGKSGSKTLGWLSKSLSFKKTKPAGAAESPLQSENGNHNPAAKLPHQPPTEDTLTPRPPSPGSAQGPFSRPL